MLDGSGEVKISQKMQHKAQDKGRAVKRSNSSRAIEWSHTLSWALQLRITQGLWGWICFLCSLISPQLLSCGSNGLTDSIFSLKYKLTTWRKIYMWGRGRKAPFFWRDTHISQPKIAKQPVVRQACLIDTVRQRPWAIARLVNTHALF